MKLIKNIKKNNGSTLTMVLFLLFLLSVTAFAVITLTGSELSMSVMTSDRSKALMIAQAGAEKAAQVLDGEVSQAQEDARVLSSQKVQEKIKSFQKKVEKNGKMVPVDITAPFVGVIDNSNINDIKILKEEDLNVIYYNEYKYLFYTKIEDWYSADKFIGENVAGGNFTYTGVQRNDNGTVASQLGSGDPIPAITSIKLTSTGEYKSPSNGSAYKRKIGAEFGLLTESKSGGTMEIPIPYGKLTKVRVNKDDKPSILKDKALIAQKNIISLGRNVNVVGNAICVGTIPSYATELDKFRNACRNDYNYGGFMAGVTSSNNLNGYNVWEDKNFGDGISSLKDSLSENASVLEIPTTTFFTTDHSGSFNIKGKVGTLSYFHSLYGREGAGNFSNIVVSEDVFARCVKAEAEAYFTQAKLKNVYTTDDLKIDTNNAVFEIGKWKNDGTPDNDSNNDGLPDTGNEGRIVGLSTGRLGEIYSSAVAVSGDSKLDIYGSVYIGGSNYYNEYTDVSAEMYLSGMSIQKSDSSPAQAFEREGSSTTPIPINDNFSRNVFYYYNNSNSKPYIDINNDDEQQKLTWAEFNKPSEPSISMMKGITGIPDPPILDLVHRAMHFKYIWDAFWKGDIEHYSYLNSGDITIKPDDGEQLKGWCFGAVAANYQVYGPYGGFTDNDAGSKYTDVIQKNGYSDYLKLMNLFVVDGVGLTAKTPQKKLNGNSITTYNSINSSALAANQFIETKYNSFMFNSDENVVLSNSNGNSYVGNSSVSKNPVIDSNYIRGIVYSNKDIYVKAGTKFKGILIAEGNIVFLGDADIEYDEGVVDILRNEKQVGNFFKYSTYDVIMNDENAIIQTIKKANVKNIKIKSWKEI